MAGPGSWPAGSPSVFRKPVEQDEQERCRVNPGVVEPG